MEWSFRYDGPPEAIDDRTCEICNAAAMKKCPKTMGRHGGAEAACPSCHAVRTGFCPLHCGLRVALDKHESLRRADGSAVIAHPLNASFEAFKTQALAYLAALHKRATNVLVQAQSHADVVGEMPDAGFESSISVMWHPDDRAPATSEPSVATNAT